MQDFNFDSSNDFNPEFNQNDCFNWSEKDWRKYLNNCQKEVFQFLKCYTACLHMENRLDEVAKMMGWDAGWSDPEEDKFILDFNPSDEQEAEEIEAIEIYTVHTQPVLIVSNGLLLFLEAQFADLIEQENGNISPRFCWAFAISLGKLRSEVLFAANCIDAGDFNLGICHLKNALSHLNNTFEIIGHDYFKKISGYETFEEACRLRLFDLRQLWIRLIQDCRKQAAEEGTIG